MIRWVRRYQIPVFLLLLVVAVWGALWVVYDTRSPVYQYLKTVGTERIDGWTATELDQLCLRFEPSQANAPIKPEAAAQTALKAYSDAYVREVVLVSERDTCNGGLPKLAWAVSLAWSRNGLDPLPSGISPSRAIIVVDAVSGSTLANHKVILPRG
jgi:hypothetical protein